MPKRKHCPKCDKSLPLLAFSKAVRAGDGLQGWCKRCMVGYKNEYADAHGDSYHKLSNQRLRWDVLVHYSEDPPFCSCCGDKTYEFLSIDHINGGGRQHRIANNWSKLYQLLKSAGLPHGYRVLCHNCNQAIGHYGFCPHQHPERSLKSRPADKRETARLSATQRVLDAGLLIVAAGDRPTLERLVVETGLSLPSVQRYRRLLKKSGAWASVES